MIHIGKSTILRADKPAKLFFILLIFSAFYFSSCNKSSVIGLDIQPKNDQIKAAYQDTLTLTTQTIFSDTLRTDANAIQAIDLLGKYIDPVFGEATSSVYTQMVLFGDAPDFGTNPVCDSVTLTLTYLNAYGKKIRRTQTINVYQLTEDLDINASYFSNHTKKDNGIDLANGYVFLPRPNDSVTIMGTRYPPCLRVPVLQSFGQAILDKQGADELSNSDKFTAFVKGLRLTTENTPGMAAPDGNILHFDMGSSTMNIYYHNNADDSLRFDISFSGARFMNFKHDYTNANPDLKKQIATSNPSLQNDVVFVQSMAGLKTRIKIPHLLEWGNRESIAINRAELVIKSISSLKDTFALIPTLNLFAIGDDGTSSYVLDDNMEGTAYFGGTFNSTDNTYRFNITRHIQQILSGRKNNNGLFLGSASGNSTATRVVLGGGAATLNNGTIPNAYQMKLNISYTKLK